MKHISLLTFITLLILPKLINAQQRVEWDSLLTISAKSFDGPVPNLAEDNVQEYLFYTTYDFTFQMTNIQFAMTKNFNKHVIAFYVPSLSWMESGELSEDLIAVANLDFDISELFARKLRKALYEEKKFGSKVNFFEVAHSNVTAEYSTFNAELRSKLRATNWAPVIEEYRKEVSEGIRELSEYCKTCKPIKKKKKGKK